MKIFKRKKLKSIVSLVDNDEYLKMLGFRNRMIQALSSCNKLGKLSKMAAKKRRP